MPPSAILQNTGLKLRQRDEPEVTNIDLSNAYHDILENLLAELLNTKQDWCELKPEDAREMIRVHAADIGPAITR